MNQLPIRFETGATLVGAGPFDRAMIELAHSLAPALIAADSAADRLSEMRFNPRAVIGDMDSISEPDRWRTGPAKFVHLAEQDTTDFEKCLYATEAPFYIAVGFVGGRVDHTLANVETMLRYPDKNIVLLGEHDVSALVPPDQTLRLKVKPGLRVSIFPLLPVIATRSRGLAWPIDGLAMAPGRQIGTSNEATQPKIEVAFDGPGALVMLEREALGSLVGEISNPVR